MKKAKNLKKRIRRLEARLQKDAKKLAKLKRKLEAAEKTAPAKPKKKSAAPGKKAGKASASIAKKNQRLALKAIVKPAAAVKKSDAGKKVKRKLNLTPERRAQLAAAMKARWVAKRAAAATNTQHSSGSQPGDASQPQ
jgi:hypothetical protein